MVVEKEGMRIIPPGGGVLAVGAPRINPLNDASAQWDSHLLPPDTMETMTPFIILRFPLPRPHLHCSVTAWFCFDRPRGDVLANITMPYFGGCSSCPTFGAQVEPHNYFSPNLGRLSMSGRISVQ